MGHGSRGCLGSFPFQLPIMESEDNLRSRQESGAIVRKPPIQEKEVHTTRHRIDLHRCSRRFESSRLDHLPASVLHCFTPPFTKEAAFLGIPPAPASLHM